MKSMQRQFGKMMTRSADESNIAVLFHEFSNADVLLSKVCGVPLTSWVPRGWDE